jgi:o-succinylbenzoate synthase
MQAKFAKYTLQFKVPGGTSRGVLSSKESFFIALTNPSEGNHVGIGECGILRGLSIDDRPDYAEKLLWLCKNLDQPRETLYRELREFPSIRFGLEMAFLDFDMGGNRHLYDSTFAQGKEGILINGLVWMGEPLYMAHQIEEKLETGYSCIKLKIGAIDFKEELKLLAELRKNFGPNEIEIRVDANGAFKPAEALEKLKYLADLELHSIEQPIAAGQIPQMAELCAATPLPIALDEELIGVFEEDEQHKLLHHIRPQYLILKPSLLGGYRVCENLIDLCQSTGTGWWVTSALESNIGLNAISQWCATLNNPMPQGLGTGQLYSNNFKSPLEIRLGHLHYNLNQNWNVEPLWQQIWNP